MRVAYIFVATGKYSQFIDGLILSGTENFFPDKKVEFIAFTDDDAYVNKYPNLRAVSQKKLGWPYDTLMRFHMINSIKDILTHDYIYFGNANMIFYEPVGTDILPDKSNDLVGSIHPAQNEMPKSYRSYERNSQSAACVPYGQEGDFYYQGCLFGGTNKAFLSMTETLQKQVQMDLDKNFIAVWHDESHMNRYFTDNKPKALHPGYVYPENMHINFPKKIIQLDKQNFGGHNYLRTNN